MRPPTQNQKSKIKHGTRPRAFTLIELLIVIAIMAILATILLASLGAVRGAAKTTNTQSLIDRLGIGLNSYHRDFGYYPPDYMPTNGKYASFVSAGAWVTVGTVCLPPESLWYCLANPFLKDASPYVTLAGGETDDYNKNGLREVVDGWGSPLLYNRARFAGKAATYYNFDGSSSQYDDSDGKPWHNRDTFDLFALGPDRTTGMWTGSGAVPRPKGSSGLLDYCRKAMKSSTYSNSHTCGDEEDDINNWSR